jgi:hypothetical protein
MPQKEQPGQGHRLRLWTESENPLPGILKNQNVAQAENWKYLMRLFGVSYAKDLPVNLWVKNLIYSFH